MKQKIGSFLQYYRRLSFNYATHFILSELARRFFSSSIYSSFSQFGEDLILGHLLVNKKNGTYVDVGCNHPVKGNNTFYFYVRGWSGLNIDGNTSFIQLYHKHRKKDISVQALVSDEVRDVDFYIANDDRLSTMSEEFLNDHKDHFNYGEVKPLKIQTQKLQSILTDNGIKQIDLLTVDVEGHDLEVLRSLDFNVFRPAVITVEMHDCSINNLNKNLVYNLLISKGYELVYLALYNGYFVDRSSSFVNYKNESGM